MMKTKGSIAKRKTIWIFTGAGLLLVLLGVFLWIWLSRAFGIQTIALDPDYQELFTEEQIKAHKMHLPEYDTDTTIGYLNQDGTKSLYVYAVPIQYKNESAGWVQIDTRLATLEDADLLAQGFAYTVAANDIVPLFPQELSQESGIRLSTDIVYTFGVDTDRPVRGRVRALDNFIGQEKNMVVYDDAFGSGTSARFYPSSLGVNAEISIDEAPSDGKLTMWLQMPYGTELVETNGGYLTINTLEKEAETLALIQKPLLKGADGRIDYSGTVAFTRLSSDYYLLEFTFDQEALTKGSTIFLSFEMRREKQPDNALYSNFPDLEYAYLRNYAVIGNSPDYGIGQLLIRYMFTSMFQLQADDILSASYSTYSLTQNSDQLELRTVLEDWCSLTGNWNDHYQIGDRTSLLEVIQPELCFDITEEVKMWCGDPDGQLEHNGVLLKSAQEREGLYNVLLSNDNTLYRNHTEIHLR